MTSDPTDGVARTAAPDYGSADLPSWPALRTRLDAARTLHGDGDETGARDGLTACVASLAQAGPEHAASGLTLINDVNLMARHLAGQPFADGWLRIVRDTAPDPRHRAEAPSAAVARIDTALGGRADDACAGDLPALVEEIAATRTMPAAWWIAVHCRLFAVGEIRASWRAKAAAARAMLSLDVDDRRFAREAQTRLAAAVHLEDAASVGAVLARAGPLFVGGDARRLRRLDADAAVFLRDWTRVAEDHGGGTAVDRAFRERVRGARVALVGPAPNDLGNGPRIDAFDVVARTSHFDAPGFREAAPSIGARCDVNYLNSKKAEARFAMLAESARNDPGCFVCLRSGRHLARLAADAPGASGRMTQMFRSVFYGRGFAMRHALCDLLRAGAASVAVFGVDFFLEPRTHFRGYSLGRGNQARAYVAHDPLDAWRQMKALQQDGLLEADAVLAPILAVDEGGFAELIRHRMESFGATRNLELDDEDG